jgi:hypothetical protein
LERDVEAHLRLRVEKAGGLCVKFLPDLMTGMPDRIVLLPGGVVVWVETKKPKGGKLSEVQKYRHKKLKALGQIVEVCWTKEDADRIVEEYRQDPE